MSYSVIYDKEQNDLQKVLEILADYLGILRVFKNFLNWTSLVAHWLGVRLPTKGTRVQAWSGKIPHVAGATKPVRHNYWA